MGRNGKSGKRDNLGYGSSYRRGSVNELKDKSEISAALGGQVWKVKPDKKATSSNPCIWMQAGVVDFKDCNNFYDCTTCKYDLGMNKKVRSGKAISWQDAMRKRPGMDRVCRHSLTNRIAKRACAYDYECATCDFDQFFEDVWTTKVNSVPGESRQIKGFNVPTEYYFHDGHGWARIESGGYLRIGMDEFSLKLLGGADGFELPPMGKELDQNKPGWGLKRDGHLADVLSPVDGVIVEVNSKLLERPELAANEAYSDGWLFSIRTPSIKGTLKSLMDDTASLDWMKGEVNALEEMIEEVAGPAATDGGYLGDDIYGSLPALGWDRLARKFLKTG